MNKYIRLKKAEIEETISTINAQPDLNVKNGKKDRVLFQGEFVRLQTLRLKTFAKCGTVCSDCGLAASYFAFEKNNSDTYYHLNLWGVNKKGKEVLFTHDHTVARGLGGDDNIHNTTTMCIDCNHKKSIVESLLCRQMHMNKNQQEAKVQ